MRYNPSECVVFRKIRETWGCLSNMASGFPLIVGDLRAESSEALYQAARFPDNADLQETILKEKNAMKSKMLSKPHRDTTRPDWDTVQGDFIVRVEIMKWVLRVKYLNHPDTFGKELLATGDKSIVEYSHNDPFWGAVPKDTALEGKNVLGRLLMSLREEIHTTGVPLVQPPEIPNFLFCGKTPETMRRNL